MKQHVVTIMPQPLIHWVGVQYISDKCQPFVLLMLLRTSLANYFRLIVAVHKLTSGTLQMTFFKQYEDRARRANAVKNHEDSNVMEMMSFF